ncbi:MAG: hypothetical protein Q8Q24_00060 [bacterium]|nr:hypothetical protein [bacterium]
MSQYERLRFFNFPNGIDSELVGKLRARAAKVGSLRVAIAHQIEEEGLLLRDLAWKFFPQELAVQAAVDEYIMTGTIILETECALKCGNYPILFLKEKRQVELLEKDPKGFALLIWWGNLRLEELKHQPSGREEKQATIAGMINGYKRFRQLYQALEEDCK